MAAKRGECHDACVRCRWEVGGLGGPQDRKAHFAVVDGRTVYQGSPVMPDEVDMVDERREWQRITREH